MRHECRVPICFDFGFQRLAIHRDRLAANFVGGSFDRLRIATRERCNDIRYVHHTQMTIVTPLVRYV